MKTRNDPTFLPLLVNLEYFLCSGSSGAQSTINFRKFNASEFSQHFPVYRIVPSNIAIKDLV